MKGLVVLGCMFMLLLQGCSGSYMTSRNYALIQVGESEEVFLARNGDAYERRRLADGDVEYHYIERIEVRPGVFDQNDYYIRVKEGRVTEKWSRCGGGLVNIEVH